VANGANSSSGTASLFIINLDDGTVIKELNTSTTGNGLSAPRAVDANADGLVDYFFAGDLLGNVWRFDVSATSTASWTFNKVFTAKDTSNNTQSITGGLGVARDPTTGKIWLFFGTGRYFTATDQSDTNTQSFYGVMVGANGSVGTNLTRSNLQSRSINVVDNATGRRAFEPYEAGVGTNTGWVIDLDNPPDTGERVIAAPIIFDTVLVFSSIVPPGADTVNSCEAGGSGYVNALNAFSGTSLNSRFFDITTDLTDGNGNHLPVGSVPITTGMPTAPIIIGNLVVVGDSSGGKPTSQRVNPPGGNSMRRLSWRELLGNQ
jgi:type IV pilus assembly protein PilY1